MISEKLRRRIYSLISDVKRNEDGYFSKETLTFFGERIEGVIDTTNGMMDCHVYAKCNSYLGVTLMLTHSEMGTDWGGHVTITQPTTPGTTK